MLSLLLVAAGAQQESPTQADQLEVGRRALQRGLHNKAYEALLSFHGTLPPHAAWAHAELQEGMCLSAARLRKEKAAISACANATALRSPGKKMSVSLLMAVGEARLSAGAAAEAAEYFGQAEALARRGDAVRHEKEAAAARQRAESAMFSSFSRRPGRPAGKPLGGKELELQWEDALFLCTRTPGCKAVSGPLLKGPQHLTQRTVMHGSADVVSDSQLPSSKRHVTYVLDAPNAYKQLPGALLPTMFGRTLPPGKPLSVQRAMALCDAMAHGARACAGFVLEARAPLSASAEYRVEFHYSKLPHAEWASGKARLTKADEPGAAVSFVRAPPSVGKAKGGPETRKREPEGPNRGRGEQPGPNSRGPNPFSQQRPQPPRGRQPPPQAPKKQTARDYYSILNVKRGASKKAIKKAYHAAAKRWHPDKNRADGQEERLAKAERNFKLIARAYEVLSDAETKAAYDRGENVDDPKWARGQAAQQEAQRRSGNVRYQSGAGGQPFNFQRR